MNRYNLKKGDASPLKIITAGSAYIDIDAYACAVALAELLRLQGVNAIAYSAAPCNYSVCGFLCEEGQLLKELPEDFSADEAEYIIVDVSDPAFLGNYLPLKRVSEVYDHHAGFEGYWQSRIGEKAHIEFIGAAATLIYREWKNAGLESEMKDSTARLLIAAILDNTLNLTSSNTVKEDITAFEELCRKADVDGEWCGGYFSAVQKEVEKELHDALFKDIKNIPDNAVLPERMAQLTVWDAQSVLSRLTEIREWFSRESSRWMINIIDISHRCSWFVCDDEDCCRKTEKLFGISFESGVAKTDRLYLRKEIIKRTITAE